jgi:hypothetical protein
MRCDDDPRRHTGSTGPAWRRLRVDVSWLSPSYADAHPITPYRAASGQGTTNSHHVGRLRPMIACVIASYGDRPGLACFELRSRSSRRVSGVLHIHFVS